MLTIVLKLFNMFSFVKTIKVFKLSDLYIWFVKVYESVVQLKQEEIVATIVQMCKLGEYDDQSSALVRDDIFVNWE